MNKMHDAPSTQKNNPAKTNFSWCHLGRLSPASYGLIPIYIDPQPPYPATSPISLPPHDDFTSLITTGGHGSGDLPTKMPPGKRSTATRGGETGSRGGTRAAAHGLFSSVPRGQTGWGLSPGTSTHQHTTLLVIGLARVGSLLNPKDRGEFVLCGGEFVFCRSRRIRVV
jgi:hypothetical protein